MKHILKHTSLAVVAFAAFLTAEAAPKKSVKVLAIGNSFTQSVIRDLNNIVKQDKDSQLLLKGAILGGCSLETHWKVHLKSEKDVSYKPYRNGKNRNSLKELLKQEKWDVVTLQQVSSRSWRLHTYEPYLGNLIALIRKHAPTAEIVLQQTWSYNASRPALKVWKITQRQMFEKLAECYAAMAKKYSLRVIPTGLAVEIYRKKMGKKLIPLDITGKYEYPKRPITTDLSGYSSWGKDRKTGKRRLRLDLLHLNPEGRYMQACLWYGFLYGKDPSSVKFVPKYITKDREDLLKSCASEALKQYKQVKK